MTNNYVCALCGAKTEIRHTQIGDMHSCPNTECWNHRAKYRVIDTDFCEYYEAASETMPSAATILDLTIQMEALITRRAGMIAENTHCWLNDVQAEYLRRDFFELESEFEKLREQIPKGESVGEPKKTNTDFESVAVAALSDPATRVMGATVAQNPRTGEWAYFIGSTPPYDIRNGSVRRWEVSVRNCVCISAHVAAMTHNGVDSDGDPVNCYDAARQLKRGLIP